jgi:hypothetical protein
MIGAVQKDRPASRVQSRAIATTTIGRAARCGSVEILTRDVDAQAGRLYRVRPSLRSDGGWAGPDTHEYYLTITRLSDGKRLATWNWGDWSDTDAYAHQMWECWRRLGWRPELAIERRAR